MYVCMYVWMCVKVDSWAPFCFDGQLLIVSCLLVYQKMNMMMNMIIYDWWSEMRCCDAVESGVRVEVPAAAQPSLVASFSRDGLHGMYVCMAVCMYVCMHEFVYGDKVGRVYSHAQEGGESGCSEDLTQADSGWGSAPPRPNPPCMYVCMCVCMFVTLTMPTRP
jgi:hypothetical protein